MLAGYFFLLGNEATDKIIYRIVILTISFIFILLFLPYLNKNNQLNYWTYNYRIFNRFAISVIYSVIIYIGLVIALLVIDKLFNAKINEKVYFDIWIFIVGFFAVTNFLSSFPKKYFIEEKIEYPKSLRIFVQFILLPLTTIYLLILYIYLFKIIFTWQLPEGIISYLVLSFSALGIFSLMTIFPIKDSDKFKWINTYAKYFYWAVLPLILLLFVSIFVRIKEYGITENRYFVIIFAVWLIFIAIYSLFKKQKDIKIITISFTALVLLASFGPWSAFNISKISQTNRLKNILQEKNIMVDGKISDKTTELSTDDYNEIYNISEYLINNHGKKLIKKEFGISLSKDSISSRWNTVYDFMDSLNIVSVYDSAYENKTYNFDFFYTPNFIKIDNYDYILDLSSYAKNTVHDTLDISINITDSCIYFSKNNENLNFYYKPYIVNIIQKYDDEYVNLRKKDAIITKNGTDFRYKIILKSLNGSKEGNKITYTYLNAWILVDFDE